MTIALILLGLIIPIFGEEYKLGGSGRDNWTAVHLLLKKSGSICEQRLAVPNNGNSKPAVPVCLRLSAFTH
jgi:hypothetical protein